MLLNLNYEQFLMSNKQNYIPRSNNDKHMGFSFEKNDLSTNL